EIYSKKLIAEGVLTEGEVEKMRADWRARLDAEYEAAMGYRPNKADWLDGQWAKFKFADDIDDPRRGNTGVKLETLRAIGQKITTVLPRRGSSISSANLNLAHWPSSQSALFGR